MNVVTPTSASVMPTAVSSGRIDRPGKVDLLADRRDLGLERAHETYTAATTKVMPNMNMQIAHTISPVRMFLRARRRVIIGGKNTSCARVALDVVARPARYRWTSATIAQNSSAR